MGSKIHTCQSETVPLIAPDCLGFSIGRYEKKRESFDIFAARFESETIRFSGKNRKLSSSMVNSITNAVPKVEDWAQI